MVEQIKTEEHKRDAAGNVVMPVSSPLDRSRNKQGARMVALGAVAFALLLTTCVFGVSLANTRAAARVLENRVEQAESVQRTAVFHVEAEEPRVIAPRVVYYRWQSSYQVPAVESDEAEPNTNGSAEETGHYVRRNNSVNALTKPMGSRLYIVD